jgi:hypothetical protein
MFVKRRGPQNVVENPLSSVYCPSIYRLKIQYSHFAFFYKGMGCKTLSLTLQEVRRLIVFQNRVVRRMFWPTKVEVIDDSINSIIRRFTICSPHQIELGWSKQENEMHKFVAHVGKRRNAYKFLVGKPGVMTPLERPRVNRRIILN